MKETQSHSQTHYHYAIHSTEPYLKEKLFLQRDIVKDITF